MVSRKHAAIERKGQEVLIRQLSKTNPTLLNGKPLEGEFYLHNGDEIQLSNSGPKIRYLATATKTSSMGVTKRLELYAKQALKPYKWALISVLLLFVISGVLAGIFFFKLKNENDKLKTAYNKIGEQTQKQEEAAKRGDQAFLENQKQTAQKIADANQQKQKMGEELAALKNIIKELKKTPPAPISVLPPVIIPKVVDEVKEEKLETKKEADKPEKTSDVEMAGMIAAVKSQVYFLKIYLTVEGEIDQNYIGSGTGFMLEDGRFITARHCVNPWAYSDIQSKKDQDRKWLIINWLFHNSPKGAVKLNLEVISPDNKKIYLPGDKFITNESKDFFYDDIDIGYGAGKVQLAPIDNDMDWAYYNLNTPSKDGITADPASSTVLQTGTIVHVLGYTYGMESQGSAPSPFYSTANVSQNGLTKGLINVTNLGFAQGNSGGPVFIEKNNKLVAIGLVSSGKGSLGMIVPLSAINK